MKKQIILALLTGLVMLTSCGKRQGVKILETGERTIVRDVDMYQTNDTIIIYYSHTDADHWQLDTNWEKFDSLSNQEPGFPRRYKAILQ